MNRGALEFLTALLAIIILLLFYCLVGLNFDNGFAQGKNYAFENYKCTQMEKQNEPRLFETRSSK